MDDYRQPNVNSRIIAVLAVLFIVAGCANTRDTKLGRSPTVDVKRSVYFPNTDAGSSPSCSQIVEHIAEAKTRILAMGIRGEYQPLRFSYKDCDNAVVEQKGFSEWQPIRSTGICAEPAKCADQIKLNNTIAENHFDDMFAALTANRSDNKRKHLFVFIHGGLNDYAASLETSIRDFKHIERFNGDQLNPADPWTARLRKNEAYHSIFISWPTGGPDTYFDRTYRYEQGAYDTQFKKSTGFLDIFSDIAEGFARTPQGYLKSVNRYLRAQSQLSDIAEGKEDDCGTKESNYVCSADISPKPQFGSVPLYQATFPLRLISVPVIDPFGKRAWDSMLARARFTFRRPLPLLQDERDSVRVQEMKQTLWRIKSQNEDGGVALEKGILHQFFQGLQKHLCTGSPDTGRRNNGDAECVELTIVAHSMGAIVTNEILNHFPNLPYRNIVFLAAANSIRDFRLMAERVIKRRHDCWEDARACLPEYQKWGSYFRRNDLRFYNVSLHPIADQTEINIGGVAPRGSLLEWIDDIYTAPPVLSDRTMGKWQNVLLSRNDFDASTMKRMRFKRFGLSCASPRKHGAFRNRFPLDPNGNPAKVGALDQTNSASDCQYTDARNTPRRAQVWQYWDPRFWAVPNRSP